MPFKGTEAAQRRKLIASEQMQKLADERAADAALQAASSVEEAPQRTAWPSAVSDGEEVIPLPPALDHFIVISNNPLFHA